MSVYDQIRRAAQESGHQLEAPAVYRVAGTIAVAYGGSAPYDTIMQEVLRAVERDKAQKAVEASEQQADVVVPVEEPDGSRIDHQVLDAALAKGICPRCNQGLRDVKLADYTPAKYCPPCRIVLW